MTTYAANSEAKTTGARTAGEVVTTPTSIVLFSLIVFATGVLLGKFTFGR